MQPEPNNMNTCGPYRIVKNLGQGVSAKVKLATNSDGQKVAIKIYKNHENDLEMIQSELQAMRLLHHENVVNFIDYLENVDYTNSLGQTRKVFCMIQQLVAGGELFDYISLGGKFQEVPTRTYFKMLMSGLQYVHSKRVCHLDIKPENLMLSEDFILKIGDFGFAKIVSEGNQFLKEKVGTRDYMAPQIYLLKYKGDQADIFSAGVILFLIYSRHPPFEAATALDPYYRHIKNKKNKDFWAIHSKRKTPGFYSQQFKNLIDGMLAFNPEQRFTIPQILEHPWLKDKPVWTLPEIKQEFIKRKEEVDQKKQKIKQTMEKKRKTRYDAIYHRMDIAKKIQRGQHQSEQTIAFLHFYENQSKQNRKIHTKISVSSSDLILKEEAAIFFSSLFTFLQQKISLQVDNQPVKFTPTYTNTSQNKFLVKYTYNFENTEMTVSYTLEIFLTKEKYICLTIQHFDGDYLYYRDLVDHLKSEFVYCEVK